MLDFILKPLADFVIWAVTTFNYVGIFVAMLVQSACIPIPSEVILPFSGFMVSQGYLNYWSTVLTAVLGCAAGSSLAFSVGYFKGEQFVRTLIRKYGKFLLIFEYELDEAEHWFRQYGQILTFVSRLLPVVRTFIALPAGISKMSYKKFIFFVIAGDLLWSALLIYIGRVFGQNWNKLGDIFHKFDLLIFLLGVTAVVWYIQHKLKKHRRHLSKIKTS